MGDDEHDEVGFMDGSIVSKWAPLAPDQSYEGKSLEHWGVEYLRWSLAQDSCDAPLFDQDGSLCDLYQDPDGPAFFLDYSPTKRVRTKCRIPQGKAIVVPLMTYGADNVGVDEPRSDEELIEDANKAFDTIRDLRLRVDGKAIEDLSGYAFGPIEFDYRVPPAPNYYSCNGLDGVSDVTISPSYAIGYVAILPPPEPGTHELQYAGVMTVNDDVYALDTRTRFVVEE